MEKKKESLSERFVREYNAASNEEKPAIQAKLTQFWSSLYSIDASLSGEPEIVDGVEVIVCKKDQEDYSDTLTGFLEELSKISSTGDLISLEAKYPSQMSDPDVSEFVNWCWNELEPNEA
ncbi:hypothetical protein J6X09_02765 [Candidatus Saccharibacteria bacterium]|nr:hypothetical protein [Candidatus Saccharibacteria bacterium]